MINKNKYKRLLIIPARDGSKRIKSKNIKKLNGKPIISYTIRTAKKSKLFDEIHVSTDSIKISNLCSKFNCRPLFLRNKKLSDDTTDLIEVFKFVVKSYQKMKIKFNEIWFMTPCSPLIEPLDLIRSSKFFKKLKTNSLLAVSEFSPPSQWALKMDKNNILHPISKKNLNHRSQDLTKTFYDTGTFGVFSSEVFYKRKKIKYSGYYIPRYKGIDVDTQEDWDLLNKIIKK